MKMFHMSSYVRQFRPSYICQGVSTEVSSRVAKLDKLRGRFYASQMFGLPSSKPLENSFNDAAHCSACTKKLVSSKYGFNFPSNNDCENDTGSPVEDTRDAKKRKSLDGYIGRNRFNQLRLSDELILVQAIIKHDTDISAQKFLCCSITCISSTLGNRARRKRQRVMSIGGEFAAQFFSLDSMGTEQARC